LEENDVSSENGSKTEQISNHLKGKFLDEIITSYKNKCWQYIEQQKTKKLAEYLKG